jgi:antitoxin component of MazEF toxin-antitoxin module
MKSEIELKKVGGSFMIVIPPLYVKHMGADAEDMLIMMDDESRHGPFVSLWKKGVDKK